MMSVAADLTGIVNKKMNGGGNGTGKYSNLLYMRRFSECSRSFRWSAVSDEHGGSHDDGPGRGALFFPSSACWKPCKTKFWRMFSTVFVLQLNAFAILLSVQQGPFASAFSNMWARRTFWLLPESFLIISCKWSCSSWVNRTMYFLSMMSSFNFFSDTIP